VPVLALVGRESRSDVRSASIRGIDEPGEMNPVHLEGIRERRAAAHRRFERGEQAQGRHLPGDLSAHDLSAVKIVPIYVSNYQLSDKMQEQARFAVVIATPKSRFATMFSGRAGIGYSGKRDVIKVFNTNAS